jgi:hypothetical protein
MSKSSVGIFVGLAVLAVGGGLVVAYRPQWLGITPSPNPKPTPAPAPTPAAKPAAAPRRSPLAGVPAPTSLADAEALARSAAAGLWTEGKGKGAAPTPAVPPGLLPPGFTVPPGMPTPTAEDAASGHTTPMLPEVIPGSEPSADSGETS